MVDKDAQFSALNNIALDSKLIGGRERRNSTPSGFDETSKVVFKVLKLKSPRKSKNSLGKFFKKQKTFDFLADE